MKNNDKHKVIIKSAEKLFLKGRFDEVTLDEVAKVAKVGKGTIYLHFRNKDDLFYQTILFGMDELIELLHNKLPENIPFKEKLFIMCKIIYDFFKSKKPIIQMHHHILGKMLSVRSEKHKFFEALRKKLDAIISDVLSEGVALDFIRTDIDPSILSRFLIGMIRTSQGGPGSIYEDMPSVATIVEIFLYGAKKPLDKSNIN